MAKTRSYTDAQLATAVASSSSWRGVLRELGLAATSAGAMRSVRSHADRIELNYGHFAGQRRWLETDLRRAVGAASNWTEAGERLGVTSFSGIGALKGHAARLGVDTSHFTRMPASVHSGDPDMANLGRAGSLLAAAWFTLCGRDVSWPLEPSRFDLLVGADSGIRRVQVKTTTARAGGTWKAYLSTSGRERKTYDPSEIDDFFIIDGDLNCYLIPVAAVGGLHAIHLAAYEAHRVAPMVALSRP